MFPFLAPLTDPPSVSYGAPAASCAELLALAPFCVIHIFIITLFFDKETFLCHLAMQLINKICLTAI